MQAPTVLAQLPRPLTVEDCQIRCSQVHAVAGARKKRRHELAVGIDGETVNIYNVQSGRLKTSYAVPPHSTFACPPCSIRHTVVNGQASERRTYVALAAPEAEIWCFSEAEQSDGNIRISTAKYAVEDSANPIVYLDTIAANGRQAPSSTQDLIVVRKDGKVQRISGDLKKLAWNLECCTPSSPDAGPQEILAATTASTEEVELSILKGRPDILSKMARHPTELDSTTFLLLLVRYPLNESATRFGVLFQAHLLPDTRLGVQSSTDAAKPLYSIEFPRDHERWSSKANQQVHIDASKGTVDVSFEKGLATYDVTGYSAQNVFQLQPETEFFSSLRRLSDSKIVAASTSAISLYNGKYSSILQRLPVDQLLVNRKRKRATGHAMEEPIIFVAYFKRLGTLVALRGHTLLSLDTGSNERNAHRREKDDLLVNAIGNGLPVSGAWEMKKPKHLGLGFRDGGLYRKQEDADLWTSRRTLLDQLVDSQNFEQFEKEVALDLFRLQADDPEVDEAYAKDFENSPEPVKVLYAVSKCFTLSSPGEESDESGSPGLRVTLGASHLLSWLARHDWLTMASVSSALAKFTNKDIAQTPLTKGSLTKALAKTHPIVLQEAIIHGRSLEISELISVIQEFILDALTTQSQQTEESVPYINGVGEDTPMADGDQAGPSALAVTPASTSRKSTASQRRHLVHLALQRLQGKSNAEIVPAMRSGLRSDGMIALIQFLRQQLFLGGYTTSFRAQPLPSPPASPSATEAVQHSAKPQHLDLSAIVKPLSCCIDALGPSSVLTNEDNFVQSLITDLRSEISSALEGVEEATYLQGILREVWRYGASGTSNGTSTVGADANAASQLEAEPKYGEIVTLYSQTSEEQFDNTATAGMLPLSLKTEAGISDYKVRRGGGQVLQRSAREKAGLQNRAVGKYAFERLVL